MDIEELAELTRHGLTSRQRLGTLARMKNTCSAMISSIGHHASRQVGREGA
jgi:hypothetical protein